MRRAAGTARGTISCIDRGDGPVLVLLHAFPLDEAEFADDAEALAPRARVIAPSMRGFGGSAPFDAAAPPSIDAMADDVAALLDALDVRERAVVGGVSMGGYVALAVARRHVSRLRGIVLADTRAEPDSDEARGGRDAAIARIEGGDYEGFAVGLLDKLLSASTREQRPDVVARVRASILAAPRRAVVDALRALRDRPDARPGLAAIDVPALVVVGSDDRITPPAVARATASALPNASLVEIPGAGHLSNLEAPLAFREAVASFVASVVRDAR